MRTNVHQGREAVILLRRLMARRPRKRIYMKEFIKQFAGIFGAGIAAACCLGASAVLATAGALGLSFLIHDAYLFPIFVAFVAASLWLLYRSAKNHARMAPFWIALAGGAFGAAGLWLLVTGLYPMPVTVYAGVGVLMAGSVWDLVNSRRVPACAPEVCEAPAVPPEEAAEKEKVDVGRRAATGATLAVAAAAAFYGMYKSVETFAPGAEAGEIACWGINACKGQTACTTALNACTGQNNCKGKGYLNVPAKECYLRGGTPLKGSEGDPEKD